MVYLPNPLVHVKASTTLETVVPSPPTDEATNLPNSEHRLVFVTDIKDIVPLATSSIALMTVHVYVHLLCPFLKEWQAPALSQKMV